MYATLPLSNPWRAKCLLMPSSAPRCGQTWWDRDYKDATNDETDVYDKGAPDY